MAKRTTSYKRLKEEREAKREAARALAQQFHDELIATGVQLDPVATDVTVQMPMTEEVHLTWWTREEIETQSSKVRAGLAEGYLPTLTFHGNRHAAPGEARTAIMWLEAAERNQPITLTAAILLSVLRSLDLASGDSRMAAGEATSALRDWASDHLRDAGVDIYTQSKTWHLPERFKLEPGLDTGEAVVSEVVGITAKFVREWSPVRVVVGGSSIATLNLA